MKLESMIAEALEKYVRERAPRADLQNGELHPLWPNDLGDVARFVVDEVNGARCRNIQAWQACPWVHPLTCGNDSRHEPLAPRVVDRDVILACPSCDYIQRHVPAMLSGPPPNPLAER